MGAAAPAPGAPPPGPQDMAPAAAGPVSVNSGDVLTITAGMDSAIVAKKITDIAKQIIGDDEDVEADVPLMQAGLTSNTAVLLRDELSKSMPGVNLPPTLMFDYPSIQSISDFIVDQAK